MRIAVLMGGANLERNVSLSSGRVVTAALRAAGHEAIAVDTATPAATGDVAPHDLFAAEPPDPSAPIGDPPDQQTLHDLRGGQRGSVFAPGVLGICLAADVVFLTLYGDEGESGHAQAVLDLLGVPYTGPPALACAASFDKDMAKRILRGCDVPTPDWRIVGRDRVREDLEDMDVPSPWIVKPSSGGSTIGLSRVLEPAQLPAAVSRAHACGFDALIETYIHGREFSVGILGDRALPVVEIRTESGIFGYRQKYEPGAAEEVCPADQSDGERIAVQSLALRAHRALKAGQTCSRVDFRMDHEGRFWCLEVNALPGMTPTSLYPRAAAAAGLALPDLCADLVTRATLRGAPVGIESTTTAP